ncbi:unnamed protein product, partial [Mycena citricolor]
MKIISFTAEGLSKFTCNLSARTRTSPPSGVHCRNSPPTPCYLSPQSQFKETSRIIATENTRHHARKFKEVFNNYRVSSIHRITGRIF